MASNARPLWDGILTMPTGAHEQPSSSSSSDCPPRCSTTEAEYHTNAQLMVSLGLVDAGYTYFGLDTGWQGTKRASNGSITWSTTTLPSGVPALAELVHGLGMKFGVYSDA